MRFLGKALFISVLALTVAGCPGRTGRGVSRSLGLNVDRGFANNCSLGVYAAQCWTLTIRNQRVTATGSFGNPALNLPRRGQTATITGIDVQGGYTGDIKPRISPLLVAGTPPPLCAVSAPVDGPTIATTVVNFRITGSIQWQWGNGYISATGVRHDNAVITSSSLTLQQFDVQNLWSRADSVLRTALRNTVLRVAEREIISRMNEALALGDQVPAGLPVYAPGVNPHASGGFCGS